MNSGATALPFARSVASPITGSPPKYHAILARFSESGASRTVRLSEEMVALLRDHRRSQAELKMKNRQSYADFDLVLSDVVMPGKSGLDLAETVRRDHPQLPIVLVSGYSEETVSGGRSIPSDIPFVEKPFTADDIAKAIATAVRMHSARAPEPVV